MSARIPARIPAATVRQLAEELGAKFPNTGSRFEDTITEAVRNFVLTYAGGGVEEQIDAGHNVAEKVVGFVFEWLVRNGIVVITDPMPNSAVVTDAGLTSGFMQGFTDAEAAHERVVPDVGGRDLPRGPGDG